MSLLQMIESSGNTVTRRVSSAVFKWMLSISDAVDSIVTLGGSQAQTRYVRKDGNDTTGTGSFNAPFLTIAAALASITTASVTTPFSIQVGPGIYTTPFAMKAWVYIEGVDKDATVLNPVQANWIDASFATGTQDTGISNVTISSNLTVNFALVASLAAGTFKLRDVLFDVAATAISFTGNNILNVVTFQNIAFNNTTGSLTLANITSFIASANIRSATLNITGTDAYATNHRINALATSGSVTVTWTGANTANSLGVFFYLSGPPFISTGMTISGAAASVYTRSILQVAGPDANTTFSFGKIPNGGTIIMANGADNNIVATPTADRTYTLEPGQAAAEGTRLRIINKSAFVITIAYAAGATGVTGQPTYVGPFQTLQLFASSATAWEAQTIVQSGTVTLTNGVSAIIPADIVVQSNITATLRDFNGGVLGVMVCAKLADRVVGTRAGGGRFILTSVTAGGVTVATDQGIYDWHVLN